MTVINVVGPARGPITFLTVSSQAGAEPNLESCSARFARCCMPTLISMTGQLRIRKLLILEQELRTFGRITVVLLQYRCVIPPRSIVLALLEHNFAFSNDINLSAVISQYIGCSLLNRFLARSLSALSAPALHNLLPCT